MGDTIRSTVRKAAKLAVYDDIMIKVKNHHTPPTIRPDKDLIISVKWIYKVKWTSSLQQSKQSLDIEHSIYTQGSTLGAYYDYFREKLKQISYILC